MKKEIAELIAKKNGLKVEDVWNLIEVPSKEELGDFAFPCFGLAKNLKKSPIVTAEDLAGRIEKNLPRGIFSVDSNGGYVNFFIDRKVLAEKIFKSEVGSRKLEVGEGKRVVIDMSSPNIAKPFGIGHLRSTIIGNSIGKIAEANGYEVVKINYLGDWGTQFGKVIFGFKKWGDENKLKKNSVEHLYELYVRASAEEFEDAAREEFRKLESGDEENVKLWKRFRKLSLEEFDGIYDLLGVEFDVVSGESFYNDKMDGVVEELRKKKLLKKDNGAEIVDLSSRDDSGEPNKEGLGVALIRKSDGTSLYATRDLAAAIDRKKKYNFSRMIYEVGNEQVLHFKQLFRILEKMGHKWSKDCVHVAHGLYLGWDGKKFSTREGKGVFMRDILEEVVEKAKKNLLDRGKLSSKELDLRARKIALAAIFYGDLKNSRESNMVFDVDRFLSFEGDTGPYLLYSYARASSIVRKAKSKKKFRILDLKKEEIRLLKKIDGFWDVVAGAYESLAPNLIANYCFELATLFNEFYHSCPVLGSDEEGFRLKLVNVFRGTLKKGLDLLGIKVLEEM